MGQQHKKLTHDNRYPDGGLNPKALSYEAALPYKG